MTARLAFLGLILLLCVGCSEDTVSPDPAPLEPDQLLTIEFSESFIWRPVADARIIISDAQGQVLHWQPCTGPGTVELDVSPRPETFSCTVIVGTEWDVKLVTDMGLQPGAVLDHRDTVQERADGEVAIGAINLPEISRYRIALPGHYCSNRGTWQSATVMNLHLPGGDAWVRIDPVDGPPLGASLHDLEVGGAYIIDFADPLQVQPLIRHDVVIPAGVQRVAWTVENAVPTDDGELLAVLDNQWLSGDVTEPIAIDLPDVPASQLLVEINTAMEGSPVRLDRHQHRGGVPAEFQPLAGELTVQVDDDDDVALSFVMTGDWERFDSSWVQITDRFADWSVRGPGPLNHYRLPQLPPEVAAEHPQLHPDGWQLHQHFVHHEPSATDQWRKGVELDIDWGPQPAHRGHPEVQE